MKRSIAAIALAATLSWGCAGGPGPGEPGYAYDVSGTYRGRLMVGDRPFEGTLRLRTRAGGRVDGALRVRAPVEIDGRARGALIDDLLRLTVTYRSEDGCDGTIEGILDVQPGGDTIEGPVTITDCGDPVAGRMSFRR